MRGSRASCRTGQIAEGIIGVVVDDGAQQGGAIVEVVVELALARRRRGR